MKVKEPQLMGHTGGLHHLMNEDKRNNLMIQATRIRVFKGGYSKSTHLTHDQIKQIRESVIEACNYNVEHDGGQNLRIIAVSRKFNIDIFETTRDNKYVSSGGFIRFNPNAGNI